MYGKSEARMATGDETSEHYNSRFGSIWTPAHSSLTVADCKHANARTDEEPRALVIEVSLYKFL